MAPSARANEKTREVAARLSPSSCVIGKKTRRACREDHKPAGRDGKRSLSQSAEQVVSAVVKTPSVRTRSNRYCSSSVIIQLNPFMARIVSRKVVHDFIDNNAREKRNRQKESGNHGPDKHPDGFPDVRSHEVSIYHGSFYTVKPA